MAFLDAVKFLAVSAGTVDFVFSSAVTGFQGLTAALAIDGQIYKYRAESADLSQWEVGYGVYTASSGTIARTTVLYNSLGTTAKINFNFAPNVGIVAISADFRDKIVANRTYYVGAVVGSPTISIASPAVVSLTGHGLSVNDPVVFSVLENRRSATMTAANPGVVTLVGHGFSAGQPIQFLTTGNLPGGVDKSATYYVIATGLGTDTFQFSTTPGGAAVNTSLLGLTFTNGSSTISTSANHNLSVGQIVQFSGTSVVNFANATNYYVRSTPSSTSFTVATTGDGTAIVSGAVTTNGSLAQNGSHFCGQKGAFPSGNQITEGTTYYVLSSGFGANSFQIGATPGGAAINTTGTVTGSPQYSMRTGNDANNGLAQTRAGAFLTPQKAVDTALANVDFGGYDVTVQLANGTYLSGVTMTSPQVGSGRLILSGNSTTPSNVFLNGGTPCLQVTGFGNRAYAQYFKGAQPSLGYPILGATAGGYLKVLGTVELGPCAPYHQIVADQGKIDLDSASLTVLPGSTAGSCLLSFNCGMIFIQSATLNILNVPSYSTNFQGNNSAVLFAFANSFNGGMAGQRYATTLNGVINTNGGGVNYWPGTSAGSTATGGQYA